MSPKCCQIECTAPAEFVIYERGTDVEHSPADNFTHACERHVGELLGTIGKVTSSLSWVVVPIAAEVLK